jgi:hypothetical protein
MTRDADRPSALDDAIDEIARAMTPRVVPDLRARVAERLEARHCAFAWWQPAIACAMVLAALVGWWVRPEPTRMSEAPPVVHTPDTGSLESVRVQQPPTATIASVARAGARPVTSGAPEPNDVSWEPTTIIPPIVVEPLFVVRVESAAPVDTSIAEIPQLVVESLHVEPLSRSEP